jgi:hypothetical protein
MQKREMKAALAPQSASAYSQADEVTGATRILLISGQLGTEAVETAPPTAVEQARLQISRKSRPAALLVRRRWRIVAPPAPLSSPALPTRLGKSRSRNRRRLIVSCSSATRKLMPNWPLRQSVNRYYR